MIDKEGFLSPQIDSWVSIHQKRNSGWFAFAQALNRLCHRLHPTVLSMLPEEDAERFIARPLFLRCHTSFQAGVVLAVHGLTGDAQGALRSAFEALFCLGACKDGSDLVERLVAADIYHKKKVARALMAMPEDLRLDADGLAKMQEYLDKHPAKYGDLNIHELAKRSELGPAYDVYFRSLSNEGSHISVASLDRHTDSIGNEVTGLRYGPDVRDVGTTIAYACVVGLYLVKLAAELFKRTDIDDELGKLWPEYTTLITATFPDVAGKSFADQWAKYART